ncbi:MAG: histidine phosphatase family protein, partial [Caulobacteraceae bacterium]
VFFSLFLCCLPNHNQGEKTRGPSLPRPKAVAARLIDLAAGGEDVLIVAHGFFNGMVAGALKRRGWRCTLDQGYRYWSARRFEAPWPPS